MVEKVFKTVLSFAAPECDGDCRERARQRGAIFLRSCDKDSNGRITRDEWKVVLKKLFNQVSEERNEAEYKIMCERFQPCDLDVGIDIDDIKNVCQNKSWRDKVDKVFEEGEL